MGGRVRWEEGVRWEEEGKERIRRGEGKMGGSGGGGEGKEGEERGKKGGG